MFKPVVPEPVSTADVVSIPAAAPVPLSVLALDFPAPAEGWASFLGKRGVAIIPDSLGRDSVAHGAAKRLLDEKRADELRQRAVLKQQEAAAVEADRVRRAQLWQGVPADLLPIGAAPAAVMLAAAKDAEPKRVSPLEEALSGETATYHPWPTGEAS